MKKSTGRAAFLLLASLLGWSSPGRADIRVVASIKPVHSLAAGIMAGVSEPRLLLRGGASAHGASLKPSDAKALRKADLIIWIGPSLERFLAKPIRTHAKGARVVTLLQANELSLHRNRKGGAFDSNHKHHDHGGHHGDTQGKTDPHIWLDPVNAGVMVSEILGVLVQLDPANALRYRANAAAIKNDLDELVIRTTEKLRPAKGRKFIVFHDAFQYFEHRFGVEAAGSITLDPGLSPGARRISEVKSVIRKSRVTCIFAEPQFNPAIVTAIVADTGISHGLLDPLGSAIPAGKRHYSQLIDTIAGEFVRCLSPK